MCYMVLPPSDNLIRVNFGTGKRYTPLGLQVSAYPASSSEAYGILRPEARAQDIQKRVRNPDREISRAERSLWYDSMRQSGMDELRIAKTFYNHFGVDVEVTQIRDARFVARLAYLDYKYNELRQRLRGYSQDAVRASMEKFYLGQSIVQDWIERGKGFFGHGQRVNVPDREYQPKPKGELINLAGYLRNPARARLRGLQQ